MTALLIRSPTVGSSQLWMWTPCCWPGGRRPEPGAHAGAHETDPARVSAFGAKAGLVGGPVLFFLMVFSFDDPVQAFLQNVLGTNDEIHFLHFLAIVGPLHIGAHPDAHGVPPPMGRTVLSDGAPRAHPSARHVLSISSAQWCRPTSRQPG